jgi:dTMP kinase
MQPGKCSNVELLTEMLERMGFDVVVYHFPEYESTIGKIIAKYLKGNYGNIDQVPKELISIAYAADRAKHAEDIKLYLENGAIVLCDRFTYSNIFNAAKLPKEQWDDCTIFKI